VCRGRGRLITGYTVTDVAFGASTSVTRYGVLTYGTLNSTNSGVFFTLVYVGTVVSITSITGVASTFVART